MTTPHKALLIQARDWIAGKGEIVFAGCGMAAVDKMNALHAALQAAIDAPEPEPVAWRYRTKADWSSNWSNWVPCSPEQYSDHVKTSTLHDWTYDAQALYTHPPAVREPLTEAEIIKIAQDNLAADPGRDGYILPIKFAHAIEAAVRAKP